MIKKILSTIYSSEELFSMLFENEFRDKRKIIIEILEERKFSKIEEYKKYIIFD